MRLQLLFFSLCLPHTLKLSGKMDLALLLWLNELLLGKTIKESIKNLKKYKDKTSIWCRCLKCKGHGVLFARCYACLVTFLM